MYQRYRVKHWVNRFFAHTYCDVSWVTIEVFFVSFFHRFQAIILNGQSALIFLIMTLSKRLLTFLITFARYDGVFVIRKKNWFFLYFVS